MAAILFVDDDPQLCAIMADVLRSAGHAVNTACDGRTALVTFGIELHDLVITDITMPGMDGLELIDALQQVECRPRIIAVSGDCQFVDPLYLPMTIRLDAQRMLTKPVSRAVLLDAVSEVLAEPAPATITQTQPCESQTRNFV